MKTQEKIILAIDYGLRRVGLAVSRVGIAEPFKVLINNDQLFSQIKTVCQQEGADLVLVGISEGEMAEKTKQFAQKLEQEIDAEIKLVDETLSSQIAAEKLAESQANIKKRRGPIDHYAAASFLHEWLQVN